MMMTTKSEEVQRLASGWAVVRRLVLLWRERRSDDIQRNVGQVLRMREKLNRFFGSAVLTCRKRFGSKARPRREVRGKPTVWRRSASGRGVPYSKCMNQGFSFRRS